MTDDVITSTNLKNDLSKKEEIKIRNVIKKLKVNIHKEYCQALVELVKATSDKQWEEVGKGLLLFVKTKNNEYLLILAHFDINLHPWRMNVSENLYSRPTKRKDFFCIVDDNIDIMGILFLNSNEAFNWKNQFDKKQQRRQNRGRTLFNKKKPQESEIKQPPLPKKYEKEMLCGFTKEDPTRHSKEMKTNNAVKRIKQKNQLDSRNFHDELTAPWGDDKVIDPYLGFEKVGNAILQEIPKNNTETYYHQHTMEEQQNTIPPPPIQRRTSSIVPSSNELAFVPKVPIRRESHRIERLPNAPPANPPPPLPHSYRSHQMEQKVLSKNNTTSLNTNSPPLQPSKNEIHYVPPPPPKPRAESLIKTEKEYNNPVNTKHVPAHTPSSIQKTDNSKPANPAVDHVIENISKTKTKAPLPPVPPVPSKNAKVSETVSDIPPPPPPLPHLLNSSHKPPLPPVPSSQNTDDSESVSSVPPPPPPPLPNFLTSSSKVHSSSLSSTPSTKNLEASEISVPPPPPLPNSFSSSSKVPPHPPPPPPLPSDKSTESSSTHIPKDVPKDVLSNERNDLLAAIRNHKGVNTLKKVKKNENSSSQTKTTEKTDDVEGLKSAKMDSNNMIDSLKSKLESMRKFIEESDKSDSEDWK